MGTKLLSDKKYEEVLRSRTKSLTKNQIYQLRKIEKAGFFLNHYKQELGDELRDEVFSSLKRRQMEILTNEKDESWERFLNSLPDEVTNKIDIL